MTSKDKDRHPPNVVPGDPVQPSNQPVEDEVVSVPLEMDESAGESVIGQQNVGRDAAEGGGEFPDRDAPARGPAPGNVHEADPDADQDE